MRAHNELHLMTRYYHDILDVVLMHQRRIKESEAKIRELTDELITYTNHIRGVTKTYDNAIPGRVFALKSNTTYSASKEFTDGSIYLEDAFNPIETKVAFKVNLDRFRELMANTPTRVRDLLDRCVNQTLSPIKLEIKV